MMTPLILDINAGEFVLLLVVAVILFGPEKLPDLARKAAQALHYVRGLAGSAQQQLREELGPEYADLDLRDLNPKQFVRKHLLEDVEPIIADVTDELNSAAVNGRRVFAELDSQLADAKRSTPSVARKALMGAVSSTAVPWDPDAT